MALTVPIPLAFGVSTSYLSELVKPGKGRNSRPRFETVVMPKQPREAVTALLLRWRQGDMAALDQLVPVVYDELRRVARAHLRAERNPSLQPTALVHELYLRLVDRDRMIIHDRTHFFAIAARLMRQILVDHARRRLADKRGGGVTLIGLPPSRTCLSPCATTPSPRL
jgi:hypothetical protein